MVSALVLGGSSLPAVVQAAGADDRQKLFAAAAKEFKVPEQVLLAVSYNESRWTPHGSGPSNDNGYGLMNLRSRDLPEQATNHGKGDGPRKTSRGKTDTAKRHTLEDAAQALKAESSQLKSDEKQNIRGGAAVLAKYGRDLNGGKLPANLNDWYDVAVAYSGAVTTQQATLFADSVYETMRDGAQLTTEDGQTIALKAEPSLNPDTKSISSLGLPATTLAAEPVDCPATVNCTFTPAAFAQNSADPTDYGNYDTANRPVDMPIKQIVIHDTEGSYSGSIGSFQDPGSYTSAHYVIRSSDGAITQMVRPKDVAWTAGSWYANMHSLNIEHEGYAQQGTTWYTDAMYRSSAQLVRYLADQYKIPLDREHIIGHDEVSAPNSSLVSGMHWDPGPYWDWNRYMSLILSPETTPTGPAVSATTKAVTISPNFATNKPAIKSCSQNNKRCTLPARGASTVYLRTQPNNTAPLLTDKYMHSNGSAGTNLISDWSATATAGRKYAVAGRSGSWTAIWFGSQKGWFYNPTGSGQTAVENSGGTTITPASNAGATVYGVAYPEAAAYPPEIPVQSLSPLYTIPAGQTYVVGDNTLLTDYYYAPSLTPSKPGSHTVVIGGDVFYQISYNHRVGYVKAADVTTAAY